MSALAEPPGCVCSAYLGTPEVFTLGVMQLATLLGFPCWLTQVSCSTPAVMFSLGVGVCLVTVVLFPPCFLFCACAASPSAASPSGFCPLTGWVGMSVSSVLVYSLVWLEGACCDFFLSACALFSLLQVHWFFWASPAPLACWGGCCFAPCVRVFQLRCYLLGLQVGFPCCLFLTLGGCTSGYGVFRVCGLRRRFRLPFVVLHPLPGSVGPSPFSGVGVVFGHSLVAPPATPGFGLF